MASVAKLHRLASFAAMPQMPVLHSPEEDLAFFCNVVFPTTEVWVTEDADTLTGFIAFRPGWVDHLYIHPAHQGRGLGRALLTLAQKPTDPVRLWTFQCNLLARRFYEQQGFRIERETEGSGNEERQPDLLYLWRRES